VPNVQRYKNDTALPIDTEDINEQVNSSFQEFLVEIFIIELRHIAVLFVSIHFKTIKAFGKIRNSFQKQKTCTVEYLKLMAFLCVFRASRLEQTRN
jgi:hypothetical protein